MEMTSCVFRSGPPVESASESVFENDEARLWLRWRCEGRRDARDRLFEIHGRWAFARAGRYARSRGFDPREVFGDVAVALLDSICRFDPAKGVRFPAYAGPRVSGALLDAGRESLGRRSLRAGASPPALTDAEDYEVSVRLRATRASSSFAPDPLGAAIERETRESLLDAMPDARAREVARRRFWLGESVDEIGIAMGLGKSVVANCLQQEVLPAARRRLRRMGLGPRPRSRSRARA
jgi:RNA polymerase sigma factor (sigma-70 family)